MQKLIAKIWHQWKHADVDMAMQCIDMGIGYDASNGDLVIQPNDIGLCLMGLWVEYVTTPYWIIRQHFCKHPHWVDESYGGPDSGCIAGYCPDCGHSFHVTMY